ncbi:excisionase family protein [Photobacterium indicum]|uniref:DNA-binding protein n=1 Tax=Photobacterium indicum TaxID=81447 RepID=A0A2T3LAJ5_9GAMM|nr:excisionase family protein [Photobacterium indicum]PSV48355.1 hypothetical protein C9J47_07465 [Photobacterium indicum]
MNKDIKESDPRVIITLPQSKWVGENIIQAVYGLTAAAIMNYRLKAWQQGVHYRKVGITGVPSGSKAKILYNIHSINEWIDAYPQM